jgi:membrane-associated protease RseP (regulator of RpoE activity)
VLLFVATFASVYLVFGFQWMGANPLVDAEAAVGSAQFSVALMAILLSHEMAHYWVARAHGFALSLPYFLPFPAAFGTFGAIIRLRSLPANRTGLLEMGAAGPIAGFVVALAAIALGLPNTVEHAVPQMVWDPAFLDALRAPVEVPTGFSAWLADLLPAQGPNDLPLMVLANPPIMDILGDMVLGEAPSRYATLDPLATAGWVGCLLTAINLIPIGQLDGGHILNAITPTRAPLVSRLLLGVALAASVLWMGWAFWGVLLLVMGAWVSLPVPHAPKLTARAWGFAVLSAVAFGLSFMPAPIEMEGFPMASIDWVDAEGEPISAEIRADLHAALTARLDPSAPQR